MMNLLLKSILIGVSSVENMFFSSVLVMIVFVLLKCFDFFLFCMVRMMLMIFGKKSSSIVNMNSVNVLGIVMMYLKSDVWIFGVDLCIGFCIRLKMWMVFRIRNSN